MGYNGGMDRSGHNKTEIQYNLAQEAGFTRDWANAMLQGLNETTQLYCSNGHSRDIVLGFGSMVIDLTDRAEGTCEQIQAFVFPEVIINGERRSVCIWNNGLAILVDNPAINARVDEMCSGSDTNTLHLWEDSVALSEPSSDLSEFTSGMFVSRNLDGTDRRICLSDHEIESVRSQLTHRLCNAWDMMSGSK